MDQSSDNNIRDLLHKFAFDGNLSSQVEPRHLIGRNKKKPADNLIDGVCIDTTIRFPLLTQHLNTAIEDNMAALTTATKEKHEKFEEDCKSWGLSFKCFAMTTFGGYSVEALDIIKKLTHCISKITSEPISKAADNIYQRISVTLQRDVARAIITRSINR